VTEAGEAPRMGEDRWAEALAWHGTLREGDEKKLNSLVGRQWQDWYADPENRRVFDQMSRLLAQRELYRRRRRPGEAALAEDSYDCSVPIAEWRKTIARHERPKQRSGRRWGWWLSGGLGVAAVTVLYVLSPLRFWSAHRWGDAVLYQTDIAGLQNVHLSDGSSILLGGKTEVAVDFTKTRRSVNLLKGQAWFKVAHEAQRPFVVSAGDGTITDLGTAFLVTRDSDRVVVTVTQGAVEVAAAIPIWSPRRLDQLISPQSTTVRLRRGEELAFDDDGVMGGIRPTDPRAATAWSSGRLTFDNQPMRYVIDAVNRYSAQHILISHSAGALRFSGIVLESDIPEWLQSLEVIFPVRVQKQGSSVLIHMRPTAAGSAGPQS
jgi:transmembrane sensor